MSAESRLVEAGIRMMMGDVNAIDVARQAAAELLEVQKAERDARDDEQRKHTRLLQSIAEMLARPDGIGGQRSVRRLRRVRVRRSSASQ